MRRANRIERGSFNATIMNIQPMKNYQADAPIDRMRAASVSVTPSDGRECSEQPTLTFPVNRIHPSCDGTAVLPPQFLILY